MDSSVNIRHAIARIPYKIEPKPEGGFVARAKDETVAPIEAPTREELTQKILAAVSAQFPEFKLPADEKDVQVSVKSKALNKDFSISTNPNEGGGNGNPDNLVSRSLEKLLGFAAPHLAAELAKQLAAQAGNGSFKVTINKKTALGVNSGPQGLSFGAPKDSVVENAASSVQTLCAGTGMIDGRPITPEPSNFGRVAKFVILALVLAVFAYLYFLSRQ